MSTCARWAPPRDFKDFKPKQHFELGEALGLMDFETAAKLSGCALCRLEGRASRVLERALSQFMLDLQHPRRLHGSEPAAARARRHHVRTAQLPKFEEDQFFALKWDLFDAARQRA